MLRGEARSMQQDRRKWLWWVAVGLWIALVLGLSGDRFSAEATSRILGPLLGWIFPALSAETQQHLAYLLRKGAHAFEYAVLAALAYRALRQSSNSWRTAGLALSLVVAVAVADETHQASSAVRAGCPFRRRANVSTRAAPYCSPSPLVASDKPSV